MSSDKKLCDICCSKKTKFVKCLFCSKEACHKCTETYIVSQKTVHCVFCKAEWNYEFCQRNFSKAFMEGKFKDYKKHILLEREKNFLPETQKELEIIEHNKRIDELINKRKEDIHKINMLIERLKREKRFYNKNNNPNEDQKIQTTYKCQKENCRGYFNSKWECGLCKTKICKDCREELPKDDEHKCNPDILKTIETIKKESKDCPKCGTTISKISGCDQMWCPECKTAFSWNTRKIEQGHIHNPHYWEYITTRGQDLDAVRRMNGDNNVPERNCITIYDIMHHGNMMSLNRTYREYCRLFTHFDNIELSNYRLPELEERNKDLRIKYLRNEIDETAFSKILSQREKKNEFTTEIFNILTGYQDMTRDLIIGFYFKFLDNESIFETKEFDDMCNEMNSRSDYILECIESLKKRYSYNGTVSSEFFIRNIKKLSNDAVINRVRVSRNYF